MANKNLEQLRIYRATMRMVEDTTGEKVTMNEVKAYFDGMPEAEKAQEVKTLKKMGFYKY